MIENLIHGIIYIQFDDVMGTSPIIWTPEDLPEQLRMLSGIKAISLLTGEENVIPKSPVIIPYPSRGLKAMIKFIKWIDDSRRGGVAQSAIALLFKESDDVIFYKYRDYLERAFDEASQRIIQRELSECDQSKLEEEIHNLNERIVQLLNDLKFKEEAGKTDEAFPAKGMISKEDIDYKFKIVVCGNPSVGKTSSVLRFTHNAFTRTYIPTLGVNVSEKNLKIKDEIVEFVLWDIAGQSKFTSVRQHFYEGADGIMLIFDLTNHKSFADIKSWYKDIKEHLKRSYRIVGFIIGNKKDLVDQREVDKMNGIKLAESLNLEYIETSALTGENIEYAFYRMGESILSLIP